ncbi:MAG TPA: hemolysin family protein [Candidatus Anaerotruncus excrementipullorum]|uniref:Hemolysin family protein n=1 Tax=Candidatus Anaerotruncus excrementipullorum TaxID=2838465 RepID=A0A9D2B728_9FIRM|nr:hemolysin family protein [Candidatus Anaerotruncus excrementipullorum]
MNHLPQQLAIQVALILLNAFFAMTEIAVISLTPAKLKKQAEEGDATARRLLKLVEEPSGFLSTIQIGITLAGLLGSAFAADSFSEPLTNWVYNTLGFQVLPMAVLEPLSLILITCILSYFMLIFGELVPKRIAMQKTYAVARIASGPVLFLMKVARPVVAFLSFSTNTMLRLLRLKAEAEEEEVTEEEIRLMVDMGEERGTIQPEEKQWIENVFDFGDCVASDTMTHVSEMRGLQADTPPEEISRIIAQTGLSRFPVYETDINHITGVLAARDFLLEQGRPNPRPVRELLRAPYFVPESVRCSVLFHDMQQKKIHLCIVLDEYGETAGLITMEDLLEEIVGNIYDEFDPQEPEEIERLGENLWRVSGAVDIDTLSEALGVALPEDEDYETLGGMVFSRLHTIPQDGSTFELEVNGLHIWVDLVQKHRIVQARVAKLAPQPQPVEEN